MLEILLVIHVVNLVVRWVLPWLEICSLVLDLVLFSVLSNSPLFLLDEVLVISCRFHISILEGSLIRSPSRVSRSHYIVQPSWEVIHLEREVAHSIHHICLLRIGCLTPDSVDRALLWMHLLQVNVGVPISCDQHKWLHFVFL